MLTPQFIYTKKLNLSISQDHIYVYDYASKYVNKKHLTLWMNKIVATITVFVLYVEYILF